MTRNEWMKEADKWCLKAREAYERGDLVWGATCERKADACRAAADFATDDDQGSS